MIERTIAWLTRGNRRLVQMLPLAPRPDLTVDKNLGAAAQGRRTGSVLSAATTSWRVKPNRSCNSSSSSSPTANLPELTFPNVLLPPLIKQCAGGAAEQFAAAISTTSG
jgi:hypothetical protein